MLAGLAALRIASGAEPRPVELPGQGDKVVTLDPLATSKGWYDLRMTLEGRPVFLRRFAGHLEDGRPSVTG